MDMTWTNVVYAATKNGSGEQVFTVNGDQSLTIETSPMGEEILNIACPSGKTWTVHVTVTCYEA